MRSCRLVAVRVDFDSWRAHEPVRATWALQARGPSSYPRRRATSTTTTNQPLRRHVGARGAGVPTRGFPARLRSRPAAPLASGPPARCAATRVRSSRLAVSVLSRPRLDSVYPGGIQATFTAPVGATVSLIAPCRRNGIGHRDCTGVGPEGGEDHRRRPDVRQGDLEPALFAASPSCSPEPSRLAVPARCDSVGAASRPRVCLRA